MCDHLIEQARKCAPGNATKPRIIPLTFLPPELKALKKGVRVFLFLTEYKGRTLPDIKPGDVLENRRGKRRVTVTKIGKPRKVRELSPTMRTRAVPLGSYFDGYMARMGICEWHTVRAITVRVQGEA